MLEEACNTPFPLLTPESMPTDASTDLLEASQPFQPTRPVSSWSELLSLEKAEVLLSEYQAQNSVFPFIHVPFYVSAEALSRERPFLFVAVMYRASYREPLLQLPLESLLRETLSTKVIVQGDISMDTLQGLVVYLAWFVALSPASSRTVEVICMQVPLPVQAGPRSVASVPATSGLHGRGSWPRQEPQRANGKPLLPLNGRATRKSSISIHRKRTEENVSGLLLFDIGVRSQGGPCVYD